MLVLGDHFAASELVFAFSAPPPPPLPPPPARAPHSWGPDNIIYEAIDTEEFIPDIEFIVYPSGWVYVSVPMVSSVQCTMDLRNFPFDTQVPNAPPRAPRGFAVRAAA